MKTILVLGLLVSSSVCFAQIEAVVPIAVGRLVKMVAPSGKMLEISAPACEQGALEGVLFSGITCINASSQLAIYRDESHFKVLSDEEREEFLTNYDTLSNLELPL